MVLTRPRKERYTGEKNEDFHSDIVHKSWNWTVETFLKAPECLYDIVARHGVT